MQPNLSILFYSSEIVNVGFAPSEVSLDPENIGIHKGCLRQLGNYNAFIGLFLGPELNLLLAFPYRIRFLVLNVTMFLLSLNIHTRIYRVLKQMVGSFCLSTQSYFTNRKVLCI